VSVNVRCAGGAAQVNFGKGWQPSDPCGWKGWRQSGWNSPVLATRIASVTAKPCPRCLGRVELIPEAGPTHAP
jgi:hypothetical protein